MPKVRTPPLPATGPSRRSTLIGLSAWAGTAALQTASAEGQGEGVEITVNVVTGTLVNIGYRTPNGNRPKTFGNRAHLWAVSADQLPWNRPPQASISLLSDQPQGDQNFENLEITDGAYLVGYAVGPDLPGESFSTFSNVVATAYIPPEKGAPAPAASASLSVLYAGIESVAFDFSFLPGFIASRAGAWVGLWSGRVTPYGGAPLSSAAIGLESDSGSWGLDGLQLRRKTTYTLGLFPTGGASRKDARPLAATTIFTVD